MISSNTGNLFFFSSYPLIRMLLEVSVTDFNFFLICVDLWAVLQEPPFTTKRCHSHIATLGNAHWPIVLPNFSMTLVPTWKSFLFPLFRWFPNFLPTLFSLNDEVCFSHAYPWPSTWTNYCAQLAAILLIVTVFHSLTTTLITSFIIVHILPLLRRFIFNSYSSRTRRICADIYNQRGRRHIRQVREEKLF